MIQEPLFDSGSKGAEFSLDRRYRYKLWREWDSSKGAVAFVGLNPSTADESLDDPTIRRCINYAKAWGYGRMFMLNIFSFRATDPKIMKAEKEPVGPGNMEAIKAVAESCDLVIGCWGVHGDHLDQGAKIVDMLREGHVPLYCLGLTKGGHPRHPLYLRKDLRPVLFEGQQ